MDECLSFVVSTGLSKGNFACVALILSHIKLFQMWVLLSKSIKIKSFSYETVKKNNDFFCPRMVVYYLMCQSSSNLKINNNKQAKLHLDACSSFLFNSPFFDTLTLVGFFCLLCIYTLPFYTPEFQFTHSEYTNIYLNV